ncbi:MAG TPA: ERF family protein [Stellaceae bacterium]|jgi:hypothetical protein|nr:ERF family protein [Stellaceae bacterium]
MSQQIAQTNGSVPTTTGGGLLAVIERLARDQEFDIAKFTMLVERQEKWDREARETIFNAEFAAMQAEMTRVVSTGKNSTFRSAYATLENLDAAARPIYTRYGFGLSFNSLPHARPDWTTVELTMTHRSGHSKISQVSGPIDAGNRARTGPQTIGSSLTYYMRYAMRMALNLVPSNNPDDDDGEAARDEHELTARLFAAEETLRKAATKGSNALSKAAKALPPEILAVLQTNQEKRAEINAIAKEADKAKADQHAA